MGVADDTWLREWCRGVWGMSADKEKPRGKERWKKLSVCFLTFSPLPGPNTCRLAEDYVHSIILLPNSTKVVPFEKFDLSFLLCIICLVILAGLFMKAYLLMHWRERRCCHGQYSWDTETVADPRS